MTLAELAEQIPNKQDVCLVLFTKLIEAGIITSEDTSSRVRIEVPLADHPHARADAHAYGIPIVATHYVTEATVFVDGEPWSIE